MPSLEAVGDDMDSGDGAKAPHMTSRAPSSYFAFFVLDFDLMGLAFVGF